MQILLWVPTPMKSTISNFKHSNWITKEQMSMSHFKTTSQMLKMVLQAPICQIIALIYMHKSLQTIKITMWVWACRVCKVPLNTLLNKTRTLILVNNPSKQPSKTINLLQTIKFPKIFVRIRQFNSSYHSQCSLTNNFFKILKIPTLNKSRKI